MQQARSVSFVPGTALLYAVLQEEFKRPSLIDEELINDAPVPVDLCQLERV